MNGCSRAPLSRRQSRKGGDCLSGLEAVDMRDLRKDRARGCLTDPGNRSQQVTPTLEIGMIVEVLANLSLDLRDRDVTPSGAGHLISEMKVFNEKTIATSPAPGPRAGEVRAMDCAA